MTQRQRKREIRKKLLTWRRSLPVEDQKQKSRQIMDHLCSSTELTSAGRVHCYLPIPGRGEVDTTLLVKWLHEHGKQVILPRISGDGVELNHYLIDESAVLKPNRWGIPEPVGGTEVSADYPDLILVPVVAADRNRNRIGYGKGFYDRFLSKARATKIGLLYEGCLLNEKIPVEHFDVPLDLLVTEEGIF